MYINNNNNSHKAIMLKFECIKYKIPHFQETPSHAQKPENCLSIVNFSKYDYYG